MAPPHQRNRAKRASVIAAFAHLEVPDVRKVAAVLPHAWVQRRKRRDEDAPLDQRGDEAIRIRCAEEEIDLWELTGQFLPMPLDHAPHRHDGAARAASLVPAGIDQGVDRFPLRGVDKAAGIDDNDVGGRQVVRHGRAVGRQLGPVALGINRVLVTAQCDEPHGHRRRTRLKRHSG